MLMNEKICGCFLQFYNSFLKIELNCDKGSHVTFKQMLFSKEAVVSLNMCYGDFSLIKCVLEGGFNDSFVLKIL